MLLSVIPIVRYAKSFSILIGFVFVELVEALALHEGITKVLRTNIYPIRVKIDSLFSEAL